jgi:hypothetical protein
LPWVKDHSKHAFTYKAEIVEFPGFLSSFISHLTAVRAPPLIDSIEDLAKSKEKFIILYKRSGHWEEMLADTNDWISQMIVERITAQGVSNSLLDTQEMADFMYTNENAVMLNDHEFMKNYFDVAVDKTGKG